MSDTKKVVGVAFISYGRLLIVQSQRSSTTNTWTMIGGGVEDNETPLDAAIRETQEEIHNGFTITADDLEPVMGFKETAASDPNLMIEMNIFICKKEIDVDLTPDEEILKYHWFRIGETDYNISSSIRDHFLPYAIEKGLLF